MTGSYQLKSTPDAGRPSTTTYPMGAFTQDYEYVAGSGDLDECNGRDGRHPRVPLRHLPLLHHRHVPVHPALRDGHAERRQRDGTDGGTDGGTHDAVLPTAAMPRCMPGRTTMCCACNGVWRSGPD